MLHGQVQALAQLPAAERRRQLRGEIDRLARLVRGLHQRRLSHRDLKASNILVSGGKMWLIDLVGLKRGGPVSHRRRIQNLARLHASFHNSPHLTRTDKLRFLRMYLQWGLSGRSGWKDWWRAIAAATAAKITRNRERGRPLA